MKLSLPPVPDFAKNGNTMWAQRHVISFPNKDGKIVSNETDGVLQHYGAHPEGLAQLPAAVEVHRHRFRQKHVKLLSSPFSRAVQTVQGTARLLGIPDAPVLIDRRFRERFFGCFDMGPDDKYPLVWAEDERDATDDNAQLREWGVESTISVVRRVFEGWQELNETHADTDFIVGGHGDGWNIPFAAVYGIPIGKHRRIAEHRPGVAPMKNAELREVRRVA